MPSSRSSVQDSPAFLRRLIADPRHFQIAVLALLVVGGGLFLDFDVAVEAVGVILAAALLSQADAARWIGIRFDARSALISGLSLALLAHSNSLVLLGATVALTISRKFLLRIDGRHVFNPTNLALVSMAVTSSGRLFIVTGGGSRTFLTAQDAFSGVELWRRP